MGKAPRTRIRQVRPVHHESVTPGLFWFRKKCYYAEYGTYKMNGVVVQGAIAGPFDDGDAAFIAWTIYIATLPATKG